MKSRFIVLLMFLPVALHSQSGNINNTIGTGGAFVIKTTADDSLFLVKRNGGVLFPRMTETERSAITGPAAGSLVYQTDGADGFYYYTGSSWTMVAAGALPTAQKYWMSPHYSFASGTITAETYINVVNPDASASAGIQLNVYDLFGASLCSTTQAFIGPKSKLAFTLPGSCPGITSSGGWFEIVSTAPVIVFGYIQRSQSGETPQQTPLTFFAR
jgi:hypothetical protein